MLKILLTGGGGFFGTRFKRRHGASFEIYSTGSTELDVLDNEAVFAAFKLLRPDIVVHAAAVARTDYCDRHPDRCRAVNVEGAVNVGAACAKYGAEMVFLSSEQVFNGNPEPGPHGEDRSPVPDTVYGMNKLEAEQELAGLLERLWVLRFTWLFGVPQRGLPVVNNILWDTVKSALKNERILASKREFRGLSDVDAVVERFPAVFDFPYGVYHIGSSNDLSRYDVVGLILSELGLGDRLPELLGEDSEKYQAKPRDVRLLTDKARAQGLEFPPSSEALNRCIAAYSLQVSAGV